MTTKKDLEETVIDVKMLFDKDCGIFKRFDNLDDRLDKYNGKATKALEEINDTNIKLAATEAIAKDAERCAHNNSRNFSKFLIAFCIVLISIVCGIGIPTWAG